MLLYRKLPVPVPFLITHDGRMFGGDVRIGDFSGDGRDELNGGCFVIDDDGTPLWERQLGRNMDSVVITILSA